MGNKQHRPASLSAVIKSGTQKLQNLWPGCILNNYSICKRSLHCRIKLIRVLRNEIGYTYKKASKKKMTHWREFRNDWLMSEVKSKYMGARCLTAGQNCPHEWTENGAQHQNNPAILTANLTVRLLQGESQQRKLNAVPTYLFWGTCGPGVIWSACLVRDPFAPSYSHKPSECSQRDVSRSG